MLESIHLKNVGPAPEMKMDLAPRLNLITGDNGLGKSFLLDVAWWALTRTWAGHPVRPSLATVASRQSATIAFSFEGKQKTRSFKSKFVPKEQEWTSGPGRPADPGLVIYARVDGGFSVWDPIRNQKVREIAQANGTELPPRFYGFDRSHVWDGLPGEGARMLCNGLIRDWVSWQLEKGWNFNALSKALETMSEPGDPLAPGKSSTRISVNDVRDYPTIHTSYGEDVAIVLASAAIRRIAALTYLLVWTWSEHEAMSKQLDLTPARRIVFLVDEVESHLHPRWQRSVVPSLLGVVSALAPRADVQLLVATHSPLVLASVEASFDTSRDAWFDLDLVRETKANRVKLEKRTYLRHGEIGNWLTSEAFDLGSPRSLEAEHVLDEAAQVLSTSTVDEKVARQLDTKLRAVLGDIDPFWVRWRFVGEKQGWLKPNGESPAPKGKRK